MPKSIRIYGTSECPYCARLKAFLQDKKVPFEFYDITANPKRRKEMIEKSGQKGTPVISIGGKILVGFDKDELSKELGF